MKKNCLMMLLFLFVGAVSVSAQVTIGSENIATSGTLLDLQNGSKDLGLKFPNVYINNANVFQLEDVDAETAKNAAGMVVFNTNSGLSKGIGLYYWDGEHWFLAGTNETATTCPTPTAVLQGAVADVSVETGESIDQITYTIKKVAAENGVSVTWAPYEPEGFLMINTIYLSY